MGKLPLGGWNCLMLFSPKTGLVVVVLVVVVVVVVVMLLGKGGEKTVLSRFRHLVQTSVSL